MKKLEFLSKLNERLSGLPEADRAMTLDYYSEIIDDRIEAGFDEDEAVDALGSIDSIVSDAVSDIPVKKSTNTEKTPKKKAEAKQKRSLNLFEIILIVLGSPLWLSILISVLAVLLSISVTIIAVIISLYATVFSIAASGIALMLASIILFITAHPIPASFLLGAGLVCSGVSILLFLAFHLISRGLVYVIKKLFGGMGFLLFGRRREK